MALGDRAFSLVADIFGISVAELIFRRSRQQGQTGGGQPPSHHIPGAIAGITDPVRRAEVSAWVATLSQAQIEYIDRITPATAIPTVLSLPPDQREQALAGMPKNIRQVGRQVKRRLEALEPRVPKVQARWQGYAARHGHKAHKARADQLREDGPPPMWDPFVQGWKNFMASFSSRPDKAGILENLRRGIFGGPRRRP